MSLISYFISCISLSIRPLTVLYAGDRNSFKNAQISSIELYKLENMKYLYLSGLRYKVLSVYISQVFENNILKIKIKTTRKHSIMYNLNF